MESGEARAYYPVWLPKPTHHSAYPWHTPVYTQKHTQKADPRHRGCIPLTVMGSCLRNTMVTKDNRRREGDVSQTSKELAPTAPTSHSADLFKLLELLGCAAGESPSM